MVITDHGCITYPLGKAMPSVLTSRALVEKRGGRTSCPEDYRCNFPGSGHRVGVLLTLLLFPGAQALPEQAA